MFNLDIPDTLLCARRLVAAKSYDDRNIEIDRYGLDRRQDADNTHFSLNHFRWSQKAPYSSASESIFHFAQRRRRRCFGLINSWQLLVRFLIGNGSCLLLRRWHSLNSNL